MKVYLIAGKAGSGKNEVARIIQEYEDKTIVTGLSKYIKLFAMEMTDWKGQDLDKPRAFLQNMGDTLRGIDEDFLIKRMVEDFKVYEISGIENVVISDVRLVHEVEYFKNNFFVSKGHRQIPSAPVVPENDPSVLFNTAGMQPLIPYLMGQAHPYGTRLCDYQKCVRTNDLESV